MPYSRMFVVCFSYVSRILLVFLVFSSYFPPAEASCSSRALLLPFSRLSGPKPGAGMLLWEPDLEMFEFEQIRKIVKNDGF